MVRSPGRGEGWQGTSCFFPSPLSCSEPPAQPPWRALSALKQLLWLLPSALILLSPRCQPQSPALSLWAGFPGP